MINVNEELYKSIAFGTIDDVKNNLNDGANPNYNPRGTPPLFLSLYENKLDIFNLLLKHPEINLNIQNIMGNTIFVECLSQELNEILDILIDNQSIMSQSNSKGEYPLHHAINYQYIDVVDKILNKYPDNINIRDNMGNTPLIIASRTANIDLIKTILKYSPDLDIKNKSEKDALFYLKRKSLENLIDIPFVSSEDINIKEKIDATYNESEEKQVKEQEGLSNIKKRRNK